MVAVMQADGAAAGAGGRPLDRHIHDRGTPEHAWRRWADSPLVPAAALEDLVPVSARAVVVAPHPDDEVIACGGALAMLADAGREVMVVGVTDGEASYPGSTLWTPRLLARTREHERAAGLRRLGLTGDAERLGLPDGGVTAAEDALFDALAGLIRSRDVLFTTWRFDGHPDHEAAGRAALRAAATRGCRCWEMPVWMWHWATPGDPRVPWARLRRLPLDEPAHARKREAIAAHDSQLRALPSEGRDAVLPDWALARVLRPFEIFIDPGRGA